METKESNQTGAKQPVLKLRATAHSWPKNLSRHWHPAMGIGGEGPGTREVGGPCGQRRGGKGEQTGPGRAEEEDGKAEHAISKQNLAGNSQSIAVARFTEGIPSRGCCRFPAEKDFGGGWLGREQSEGWGGGEGTQTLLASVSAPRHRYQLAQGEEHVQVSPDRWVVAILDKAIVTKLEKFCRGKGFKTFPCHSRGSAWSGLKSQDFPIS